MNLSPLKRRLNSLKESQSQKVQADESAKDHENVAKALIPESFETASAVTVEKE
jgi:hypothetical protein